MASPLSAAQPAQQPTQQRSVQMSREEFETRMLSIVSRLEMTNAIFFYKKVSKCTATEVVQGPLAYSLEFPHDFLTHHGKKFGMDVTFGTIDSHQTWPIQITIRHFKNANARVFAYGPGGWKAFVMDNHIKVGDILIFKLLRFSHFEVAIGRSPVEVHSDDNNNVDQDDADQASIQGMSSKKLPLQPRFVEIIRRPSQPEHPENHFYLEKDLSLVVPLRFWELHSHMLEGDKLQLKGPTKSVTMVKVERTYDGEVQKVRLGHSGWKAFLLTNNLAIGDVLEFSLVGSSSFRVKVVGWTENY